MKQIVLLLFLTVLGCNSIQTEHVVDNYYIVSSEGISDLSYKLDDDNYVERISGNLTQYGFNQNYVVVKIQNSDQTYSYFIIDRKKDSALAIENDFHSTQREVDNGLFFSFSRWKFLHDNYRK